MQFLWQYFEDMVGKGLEKRVLAELFLYASASFVSMALPLAILLSSIMTFGNLGENYELVAIKASGVALKRIMRPLLFVTLILSGIAFFFSNNVLPVANLKFKSLLHDIMHQRPALDFKPGVFYDGIDGYVIRVKSKGEDGKSLQEVLIYDHSNLGGNRKVISAESGEMSFSQDMSYLTFKLFNGYHYDEQEGKNNPLARSKFKEHRINFNLGGFQFERTDENLFKDHYQMLNLSQLQESTDSLRKVKAKRQDDFALSLEQRSTLYRDTTNKFQNTQYTSGEVFFIDTLKPSSKIGLLATAINLTRGAKTFANAIGEELNSREERIVRHEVEWHRKFTLSIACIVLFFIGAPLGAIIRKGGLGMPVVVSVVFFLFYHIIGITGEKLVKNLEIEPILGMWISTIILSPIGVYLTYKATTDSVLLDSTFYTKLTEKALKIILFWKKKKQQMKILQLCHKPPFPPNDGGTKAMHANTVALQKLGYEVHVLTIETPKHPVLWQDLEGDYIHQTDFTAYFENTTPSKFDALQAFLFNENYHLQRFNIPEFHALIQKKLADTTYNAIWLESLYVANYISTIRNSNKKTPIILRAHNVEYKLWSNRLNEYNFPSSLFIKLFNKKLEKAEKEAYNKVNGIAAISEVDAVSIINNSGSVPVYTLPYFVNERSTQLNSKKIAFGYLGALDWEPNIQGVLWLVKHVWPKVKQVLTNTELYIAGRNMDDRIKNIQQDGVVILGEVENADEFISSVNVLTVPLFSSSGIRIKLIEAFASKKAVVASTPAINGLSNDASKACLVADDAKTFAESMIELTTNTSKRINLQEKAFIYYQNNYSEQLYLDRLNNLLKEVLL